MDGITNYDISTRLRERFGQKILTVTEPYGMLTADIDKESVLGIIDYLLHDPDLQFSFLTDLCGIHYPERSGEEFGVIYHLHSFTHNLRIRIRLFVSKADPAVQSLTPLFQSANWMERETFDFYGILFQGHPNLKRILNMDEMNYFPLQKQYPLEDQMREDKKDEFFGR
jgi:NADH-quinone oxidoreductase subunit C